MTKQKKSINRLKIKQHCFNQLKTGKLSDHMSNNENHHAMPISEWRHWWKKKRCVSEKSVEFSGL